LKVDITQLRARARTHTHTHTQLRAPTRVLLELAKPFSSACWDSSIFASLTPLLLQVVVKLQGWGAPADWASADTPADEDVAAQEASTPPRQRGFDNDDWKSGGVAVAAPAAAPAPEKPPTSSLPEDQVSSTDARPEPSSPRPDYSQYRLLSDAAAEASATEVEQTAQDAGKTKSGKGRGKKGKKK